MKKFRFPVLLITALLFAVSCAGTKPLANAGKQLPLEVTIIHINDHHSNLEPVKLDMMIGGKKTKIMIGGYPEAVHEIKSIKAGAKNPITLHAGDAITGTLYFTLFGGSADAAMMNITGFDYFTLGNHEFDAGNEGLKKFLDYLKVPVISANVIPEKKSILHGMWGPYAIMELEGQKIGIIGLDTVRKTVDSSSPGKDIHFTDEVTTSQKYADILKKKGINKIILLSHAGSTKNFEIAQKVSGIDIIITGDTHWLFGSQEMKKAGLPVRAEYPVKFMSPANEPVYVVEGWEYSKLVGELNVKFDAAGIVSSIQGKPHVLVHDSWFERRNAENKKYQPSGAEKDEIILADDKKMYKMGTNAYIAGGKDGYVTLGKITSTRGGEDTYLPDAESFIKFLKKNPGFQSYTESNVLLHYDPNNEVKK